MILRPLVSRAGAQAEPIPAWDAVFPTQRQPADRYLLVTQDDHAQLAGELAAAMQRRWLPELSDDVVTAIRLHDCGWQSLDDRLLAAAREGKRPPSFLDMSVPEFLAAWTESIERAAQATAIGGVIVSLHFSRLAKYRLVTLADTPEDKSLLRQFRSHEESRRAAHPCERAAWLTDVLQLCDLMSLCLCCGTTEVADFPSVKEGLRLRPNGEEFVFEPSILVEPIEFSLPAVSWPVTNESSIVRIVLR